MKMRDDPKIKAVNWYLDFLNDDLDAMSELDFSKRVLETQWYFRNQRIWRDDCKVLSDYYQFPTNESALKDTLKTIQKDLKEIVDKISKPIPPPPFQSAPGSWFRMLTIGGVEATLRIEPDSISLELLPIDRTILRDKTGRVFFDERTTAIDKMITSARISFCVALSELPRGCIKLCKECGKYFLHLTKKTREFCSTKCGSRYINREKRKADRKAYNKKQRQLMRRRLAEKAARKQGKSPDKVRIQERV